MRVISGSLRGLKLISPDGTNTRPTLDRVKEAVFSIILPYIQDAVVLDLFAGSGALGIESLSRGAEFAVFVDNNKEAAKCINFNLTAARFFDRSTLNTENAFSFLKRTNQKFDIIFLDPPYSENLYSESLEIIKEKEILSKNGIIVAEWDCECGFTNELNGFQIMKEKKYGRVGITILKRG